MFFLIFSAFTFDVSANTTGSNITGTITVTSVSNPSISDTLNVEQGIQDTVTVTAAIQQVYINPTTGVSNGLTWSYVHPPANSNAGWFTSFSGTGSNPIIPAEQTEIELKAEFDQPSTTAVSPNFSVVYSDPNNTGWINSFLEAQALFLVKVMLSGNILFLQIQLEELKEQLL